MLIFQIGHTGSGRAEWVVEAEVLEISNFRKQLPSLGLGEQKRMSVASQTWKLRVEIPIELPRRCVGLWGRIAYGWGFSHQEGFVACTQCTKSMEN